MNSNGRFYLGIDPGKSGGIAFVDSSASEVFTFAMPKTPQDIYKMFYLHRSSVIRAALEKVHSMPKQGVASAFTFGVQLGYMEMVLAAVGVSYEWVTPQRWQKDMQCLSGGDKNVTKRAAQRLFPDLAITHSTADSVLIAEWLRSRYVK